MTQEHPIWDMNDAAKYLRVSRQMVMKLVNRGVIPGFKCGVVWRFRRVDIEDYAASGVKSPNHGGNPKDTAAA